MQSDDLSPSFWCILVGLEVWQPVWQKDCSTRLLDCPKLCSVSVFILYSYMVLRDPDWPRRMLAQSSVLVLSTMQSSSKFGPVFFKVIQDSPPPATAQPCENTFVETSSVTCQRLSFLIPYGNILLFIQHFTRFKVIIGMNISPFWTQWKSSEVAWIR